MVDWRAIGKEFPVGPETKVTRSGGLGDSLVPGCWNSKKAGEKAEEADRSIDGSSLPFLLVPEAEL